jgi:hypothetical protein
MGNVNPHELMVTFWPLQNQSDVNAAPHASCKQWVPKYGYVMAAQIASSLEKPGVHGPILAAWATPWQPGVPGKNALVLDMSDFHDADFDRAFGIWKDRIARNPSDWNLSFSLVVIREKLRNLIQTYGEQIVAVIQTK